MSKSSRRDRALVAVVALRDGTDPASEDYGALREEVAAYLRSTWPNLSEADVSEVVDEAVLRLLSKRIRLNALPAKQSLGYLMRIARNLQVDRFRASREIADNELVQRAEESSVNDDEILRLIEQDATMTEVHAAIEEAWSAKDDSAFAVAHAWLDLASELDREPTEREIAELLGMPQSTVSDALRRFKARVAAHREKI